MSFQIILALVVLVATLAQCEHYERGHPIELSRHPDHHISHIKLSSLGNQPKHIHVKSDNTPIVIHFHTASSPIKVTQSHYNDGGSHHESYSQDKPHKLVHTVHKPVYQEVKEIVTPHRKITQVVKPVKENIQTHVAKHDEHGYGHEHKHDYKHKESHEHKGYGQKHKKYEPDHKEYGHKLKSYGHDHKHHQKHKESHIPHYSF